MSGRVLKLKAGKFHNILNLEGDFVASDGWLWRWLKRHGIKEIIVSGESRSCNHEDAREFITSFIKSIKDENYTDDQLYHCDETALFYRMLPSKSLDLSSAPNKAGFKANKDRVTLLFCVNKSGKHKLPAFCIGKSKNPRCFQGLDKSKLPVTYSNSSNAWMTATIFYDWFHNEFVPMVQKFSREEKIDPRAMLLLDNCPAHPPAESLVSKDGKTKVLYLPKNTTALIQPLDQGIIHAFKANYRRDLLLSLLAEDHDVHSFLKKINMKEMLYKVSLAWDNITNETVRNCWNRLDDSSISKETATASTSIHS